jgi:hypothetical protein
MRVLDDLRGVGAGNEPQPFGRRLEPGCVRGYYVDLTAKTTTPSALAADRLQPAGLAQLALGWHERALEGDVHAAERFEALCALLADRGVAGADGVRWPYTVEVPKYRLRPPWSSAMAQGQAASVFVRAFAESGDERWRTLALDAARPLLAEDDSDLVAFLPAGPALQEVPGQPRAHVLNGWIYALWGLWDVHVGLGGADAGRRFDESTHALLATLPLYDVGWWTRYSLYPHPMRDLAKPFYHRLHVTQMRVLGRLTGHAELAEIAERWQSYDDRPRRARATVQKAAFRAARSVHRR